MLLWLIETEDSNCSRIKYYVCKSKVDPLHAMDGAWRERRYSSYSFLTSALEGGVVSMTPRPHYTPGERITSTHSTPVPTHCWMTPTAGRS
jgi:hypothetical protein